MSDKLNLAVFFGGKCGEHEISVISARNILALIDHNLYNLILIGISKQSGCFYHLPNNQIPTQLTHINDEIEPNDPNNNKPIPLTLVHFKKLPSYTSIVLANHIEQRIDLVFPILHGPFGEDGLMQGFLDTLNVPYIGCDVLAASLNMDKELSKIVARYHGIKTARFVVFERRDERPRYESVCSELGGTFFVKPTSQGSSIGVSKVKNELEYVKAVDEVFAQHGNKRCICEEFIDGREIECALVMGGDNEAIKVASALGEVVPHERHGFYSYEAKYVDPEGARLVIPAELSSEVADEVRRASIKLFKNLKCRGLARIDFLVRGSEVFFNEVNTLPGFTDFSMFPKLWEKSGVEQKSLVAGLIETVVAELKINKQ